jgi:hypothetical protein
MKERRREGEKKRRKGKDYSEVMRSGGIMCFIYRGDM